MKINTLRKLIVRMCIKLKMDSYILMFSESYNFRLQAKSLKNFLYPLGVPEIKISLHTKNRPLTESHFSLCCVRNNEGVACQNRRDGSISMIFNFDLNHCQYRLFGSVLVECWVGSLGEKANIYCLRSMMDERFSQFSPEYRIPDDFFENSVHINFSNGRVLSYELHELLLLKSQLLADQNYENVYLDLEHLRFREVIMFSSCGTDMSSSIFKSLQYLRSELVEIEDNPA